LQRTTIVAPVTGYIAQRGVQLGQQVQPGTPLLSIIPLNQLWVDANFREVQLQNIQQGQPVKMTADIYGSGVTYHGTVAGLGAGTGSAFALLPPQNATGNWIKIVQRLPVRITLNPQEIAAHPLRIGLSVFVDVDIHNIHARRVAEVMAYAPRYSTPVFAEQQDRKIDQLINQIVQDNTVQVNKKTP
jgi:membrane fusion protein (multidrug efflux system)